MRRWMTGNSGALMIQVEPPVFWSHLCVVACSNAPSSRAHRVNCSARRASITTPLVLARQCRTQYQTHRAAPLQWRANGSEGTVVGCRGQYQNAWRAAVGAARSPAPAFQACARNVTHPRLKLYLLIETPGCRSQTSLLSAEGCSGSLQDWCSFRAGH